MIIDISKIETGESFKFTSGEEDIRLETANYRLIGQVAVSGTISRSVAGVEVVGKITGEAEIDCTRCLEPIRRPLAIDLKTEFVRKGEMGNDGEHEIQGSDLDADELEGDFLDLNGVVREQILLSIPEKELCSPECKGLCEKCGENLNLIDCRCGEDEIDPRWAALKSLK